jgi:hypothetical protein
MMSPAGYDDRGNLFVPGENNATGDVSVLFSGATSMTQLPLNYSFNTPGAATWDGESMTLSDEGANGEEDGIVRVTISGSSLHDEGRTLLGDTCYGAWEIELAPFILGSKIRRPTANKARSSWPTTHFAQSRAQSRGIQRRWLPI